MDGSVSAGRNSRALWGAVAGIVVPLVGLLMVAALLLSTVLSLATGSPRALLARDGILTAAWACYMYASVLPPGRSPS